jgi:hypothetical protein
MRALGGVPLGGPPLGGLARPPLGHLAPDLLVLLGSALLLCALPATDSCTAANSILFDHFIGADKQTGWYGKAERPRGLEIDDQLDFRRLLDRQLGWLFAF